MKSLDRYQQNYNENGFFYVNYTKNNDTFIERYTVSSNPNIADSFSAISLVGTVSPARGSLAITLIPLRRLAQVLNPLLRFQICRPAQQRLQQDSIEKLSCCYL